MTHVRIVSPYFVAGLEAENGKVVAAAPILRRRMMGRTAQQVAEICTREGWTWQRLDARGKILASNK